MTLDDLRKRATASEITLIDAVTAELKSEVQFQVKKEVFEFIKGNPPPDSLTHLNPRIWVQEWFNRMQEHLDQNVK